MKFRWMVLSGLVLVFFAGRLIAEQVRNTRVQGAMTVSPVHGLILPHHELARSVVLPELEKLATDNTYDTIVIFSPNHFRPETNTWTVSDKVGNKQIASDIVDRLSQNNRHISYDSMLVEQDHGLTVPMEYLAYYFPKARFVPILVSLRFEEDKLIKMAEWLTATLPANTLYVASVDLAHEVLPDEAMNNNKETITTIRNFDYRTLFTYDDRHLDSRAAAGTLMLIMEHLGARNWQTLTDTNAAMILHNPTLRGTSYVVGVFR